MATSGSGPYGTLPCERCEVSHPWRECDTEGMCGRLLVGQGDDTYDPLCVLPAGHDGLCRPAATHAG